MKTYATLTSRSKAEWLLPYYAGKIVTVHVEDTHFRVTCDGAEIALHPRTDPRTVTRWKAKIYAPKPESASSNS